MRRAHSKPPWVELLDGLSEEAQGRLRDFDLQGLANTAWAFATAGHAAPALFDAIAEEAQRKERLRDFDSQSLINTAWAFATINHAAPDLFKAIEVEAKLRGKLPENERGALTSVFSAAGFEDVSSSDVTKRMRRMCRHARRCDVICHVCTVVSH